MREKKEQCDYMDGYDHKLVIITLVNGETVGGKLHCGRDFYNVMLEVRGGVKWLIPKHAIVFIKPSK